VPNRDVFIDGPQVAEFPTLRWHNPQCGRENFQEFELLGVVVGLPRGEGVDSLETTSGDLSRLRLLDEIVLSLNRGNSLEEVFNLIFERLEPFVPYHRIAVALMDARKDRLSILCARSDGKLVMGKGYSGQIAGSSLEPLVREGRTRIINDLQAYLASKPESESTRLIVKEGMRSSLTLPLLVDGAPIGVMFFSSRQAGTYRPAHEDFLRSIVGHMAMAVEKSRLIDALREKGEYLESILQNSADAIVAVDPQNRIRTWNEGARRMFGYAAADAVGRDYEMLIPEDGRSEARAIRERIEREGFVKDYESVRLTQDGRPLTVNVTSTALHDKAGRALGRASIIRDVTHLKRLQQDLVTSQSLAAVGELAATVAHEIKNPLAGISGAIQILSEGTPAGDLRRGIMKEILDQIERLDRTVRDLLTFARPATPAREEVDLGDSLQRAWTLLSAQPAAAGVRFSVEGGSGVRVTADPHLLHQVWLNLFQNAVEAMPKGGELTARVRNGSPALVEVSDSGAGFPADQVERIFKPFFTTKTRGTGLGLPITRKNLEAHGGRIRAESRPGRTTFYVEMPR
jgi:PAS domain S-box-containing protein